MSIAPGSLTTSGLSAPCCVDHVLLWRPSTACFGPQPICAFSLPVVEVAVAPPRTEAQLRRSCASASPGTATSSSTARS